MLLVMTYKHVDTNTLLRELGQRLKDTRLTKNESQELFAQRLSITRQTLAKMEQGSPQTQIGHWVEASNILGRLDGWFNLLVPTENLFEQYDHQQKKRKHATGTRKNKIGK